MQDDYYFDYALLFIVLFLLVFGLVMLYSVSSYEAALDYGDSAYYLKKQAFSTCLGLVAMFLVAQIDYHVWEKFAAFGYLVSVVSILLVKSPIGKTTKGASRWIMVGPISIQPAEIAKLAMILFLAVMVCKMGKSIRTWKGLFFTPVVLLRTNSSWTTHKATITFGGQAKTTRMTTNLCLRLLGLWLKTSL